MQLVITNSMRNVFLDCPQRFFLEYVLRLTSRKEATYFKWGRLIHELEESRDNGEEVEKAIDRVRQEAEKKMLLPEELEELDEMIQVGPYVLDAYLLKYHEENKRYETLAVEQEFSLPLPCGFVFQGKIDKIARDRNTGFVLTWERKTAAATGDDYWNNKLLDSQPKGYLLATQRCIGFDASHVLYDIYKKPGIRQKKTQTRAAFVKELQETYLLERDKYFERRVLTYNQNEIDAYFWELDQVAQDIEHHLTEGLWPRHHPGNRKGGCSYEPICLSGNKSNFVVRNESMLCPELNRKE